jgi:hypothetical protein
MHAWVLGVLRRDQICSCRRAMKRADASLKEDDSAAASMAGDLEEGGAAGSGSLTAPQVCLLALQSGCCTHTAACPEGRCLPCMRAFTCSCVAWVCMLKWRQRSATEAHASRLREACYMLGNGATKCPGQRH